ncbi:protein adenylyltransferase SelO [Caryophanon latum]|uniref:Protein nucleotidyltransferase YdiU n=1 Tax=Caryophanon latum TaxID=33977 RepID=A0A1C0Z0X0_9BACL|nr:YdiU family protein [Caryophanon latum]OCS93087.1 hypothetical protein A6K76_00955 [Caryophanon latum]
MKLKQTYKELPSIFYADVALNKVASPHVVLWNEALANELQLPAFWREQADYFAGNDMPEGAAQIAQAYAGHQFGHFTMLGDGRALLIGEVETERGLVDVQLKGAGRTPFSRGGDGRAALGPMLREFIISEAMHALGIPTTRSLAVTLTGELVQRESLLEGAVLTRTASSHLRVGTFQYARQLADYEHVKVLADYAIMRHDADLAEQRDKYVQFLQRVIERQAKLLAQWQCIGFVHGVMNTDNMTISGETIDYGPCAFLDTYDLGAVFSSIDRQGRYAFGNQPKMAGWNLARLAESILPLFADNEEQATEAAQAALNDFPVLFNVYWLEGMREKLGLFTAREDDRELVQQLLLAMQQHKADYTETFRALAEGDYPDNELFESDAFFDWEMKWQQRLLQEDSSYAEAQQLMQRANPIVIPRNERVNEAIRAAEAGDFAPVEELLHVLSTPYTLEEQYAHYAKGPEDDRPFVTYCGT